MGMTAILYLYLTHQQKVASFVIPEELIPLRDACVQSGAIKTTWAINSSYLTWLRSTSKAATAKQP